MSLLSPIRVVLERGFHCVIPITHFCIENCTRTLENVVECCTLCFCKKNPSRPCPGNLMRGFAKDCKLQAQIYGLLDQYIMPDKIFQQIRFPGNGKVTKYNGKEFLQQTLWNTHSVVQFKHIKYTKIYYLKNALHIGLKLYVVVPSEMYKFTQFLHHFNIIFTKPASYVTFSLVIHTLC